MNAPTSRTAARPVEQPEPRFAATWATLTYAVCTMLLAWPALGGGFLVNPRSDQYTGGWPVRDFAGQALKAGQGIPEWNPYLFGGLPYIAAMHGDIFYPTALLRLLLPTDVGLTWGFILHIFLAGCFTYGFLRAWGFGFFPSLIAGIGYMMSGELAGLVSPGHDGKLFVSALMPLTLWFLVRGIRDARMWAWGSRWGSPCSAHTRNCSSTCCSRAGRSASISPSPIIPGEGSCRATSRLDGWGSPPPRWPWDS